jgi:nucleotide-binding universal stress UspA family protein
MLRSILVPLDGSQFAEEALPLALRIANRAGASLEILRVRELYALQDSHACWAPYDPAAEAAFKQQEQAYLDALVERLQTIAAVPVTCALVGGLVEGAILRRARTKPADLIVMTTHGRGPLTRFWLGSLADDLVRHGPTPILLVRPQEAPHELRPKPTSRRVLIPLDGSELAERVLEPATALGSLVDAEYTLVRAVEPHSFLDGCAVMAEPGAIEKAREQRTAVAQTYLDGVAERLRIKGLCVHTQVVVGESAAAAVLAVARDQNIDLVAIATHGRGGLTRLLLGSVADKIIRRTFTPVLVYRPTLPPRKHWASGKSQPASAG